MPKLNKIAILIFVCSIITFILTLVLYRQNRTFVPRISLSTNQLKLTRLVKELNLSKVQKQTLLNLDRQFQTKLVSYNRNTLEEQVCLNCLFAKTELNEDELNQSVHRLAKLEFQHKLESINHFRQIADTLNPKQRDKFFSLIAHELCTYCQHEYNSGKCVCGKCHD